MGMRPGMIATFLAMHLVLNYAEAQTMTGAGATLEQNASPNAAQASDASLTHSVLKAITYKTATTAANVTIFSVAAGGMVAGAALTAFGLAASTVVYAVNDYAWTSQLPSPKKHEGSQTFDTKDEFWRTTEKFLTFKAATLWIKAIKAGSLYAYTASSTATIVAISAATAVNAGIFYANNFAWDYYDSFMLPPPAAVPPTPPPLAADAPPALPQAAALQERTPKS